MIKPRDILRLIKKHILLLILIPAALGTAVAFLTHNTYQSKTVLYTGMTSGTNVQIDQSFNVYTSNASFDNLINIIQSRETSQEVGIRLLAQHLMMKRADPRYISYESFADLRLKVPAAVRKLVANPAKFSDPVLSRYLSEADSAGADTTFTFLDNAGSNALHLQPPYIDQGAYEKTVANLTNYLSKDDTNFIYRLINGNDHHYSVNAISAVNVQRIGASDLIELKYTSDDPGICQQTLALLTEACMKNYRDTKETRSDAVAKYFEVKTKQAYDRLTLAESQLQKFNQDHNIVDYADQSKAAAGASAGISAELQNKRIKLIGLESTVGDLQEKLNGQQRAQLTSSNLIDKRNQLAEVNARIATLESSGDTNDQTLGDLKDKARQLNQEIGDAVSELYTINSSTQGLNSGTVLNSYLTSVRELQETKASIDMLEGRLRASQREYKSYEPAGVELKRIEREITLAEQEYMEMLRGLNLAKLKLQDVALSSNIKAVDPPYYPLKPNAGKRYAMIGAAGSFGLLLVIFAILALEYFDETLRNPRKAAKILNLEPAGVFPKLNVKNKKGLMPLVTNRLVEMMIQQINLHPSGHGKHASPRTILLFSTLSNEGKSLMLENLSRTLRHQGKRVISINFSGDTLLESDFVRLNKKDEDNNTQEILLPEKELKKTVLTLKAGEPVSDEGEGKIALEKSSKDPVNGEHLIYKVDQQYYSVTNYIDLLDQSDIRPDSGTDYVLIELPAILYHSYPAGLVSSADAAVLVCRANRSWSEADQGALDTFIRVANQRPLFVLNGVENHVVRSSIGELPKKNKGLRKKIKKNVAA